MKAWVAANIDRWRETNPEWFDIKLIPEEFLPPRVVVAEGGESRRREEQCQLAGVVGGGDSK